MKKISVWLSSLALAFSPQGLAQVDHAESRQAIANLLASYGYLYDEGHMDEYFALFADDAVLVDAVPGKAEASLTEFSDFLLPRVEHFAKNDIQRRHVLAPVRIESLDENEASGQVYLQLYSIAQGGPPQLLLTGVYHFSLRKSDDGWKIARWRIAPDSRIE